MTEDEFRDALRLLDSATALLRDRTDETLGRAERLRQLRELAVQFDLLGMRLRQAPVELRRN